MYYEDEKFLQKLDCEINKLGSLKYEIGNLKGFAKFLNFYTVRLEKEEDKAKKVLLALKEVNELLIDNNTSKLKIEVYTKMDLFNLIIIRIILPSGIDKEQNRKISYRLYNLYLNGYINFYTNNLFKLAPNECMEKALELQKIKSQINEINNINKNLEEKFNSINDYLFTPAEVEKQQNEKKEEIDDKTKINNEIEKKFNFENLSIKEKYFLLVSSIIIVSFIFVCLSLIIKILFL